MFIAENGGYCDCSILNQKRKWEERKLERRKR